MAGSCSADTQARWKRSVSESKAKANDNSKQTPPSLRLTSCLLLQGANSSLSQGACLPAVTRCFFPVLVLLGCVCRSISFLKLLYQATIIYLPGLELQNCGVRDASPRLNASPEFSRSWFLVLSTGSGGRNGGWEVEAGHVGAQL